MNELVDTYMRARFGKKAADEQTEELERMEAADTALKKLLRTKYWERDPSLDDPDYAAALKESLRSYYDPELFDEEKELEGFHKDELETLKHDRSVARLIEAIQQSKAAAAPPAPEGPKRLSVAELGKKPQLKALRDAIERSIREEKKRRTRAGEAASWALQEATKPTGPLTQFADVVRAIAPGASPRPAVGALPHAALGVGGALAGETLQRMFGKAFDPSEIAKKLKMRQLGGAAEQLMSAAPSRLARLPLIGSLFRGATELGTARELVAGAAKKKPGWLSRLLPGRVGAIGGALAATAIPAVMNLMRTKQLRGLGGERGARAISAAKSKLQEAEMLKRWRRAVLEGMEKFGPEAIGKVPSVPFMQHAPRVDISKLISQP